MAGPRYPGFDTLTLHAGQRPDSTTGARAVPIYQSVSFVFEDADPRSIRAPYGDRDSIGSSLDYGGVILDTRDTRRTAILFLANPRGIQYDAVTDDARGLLEVAGGVLVAGEVRAGTRTEGVGGGVSHLSFEQW